MKEDPCLISLHDLQKNCKKTSEQNNVRHCQLLGRVVKFEADSKPVKCTSSELQKHARLCLDYAVNLRAGHEFNLSRFTVGVESVLPEMKSS